MKEVVKYAELQITSNFSFLQGASHPQELARQAALLGLTAIAITDRNSIAGIVRAFAAAKETGLRLVVGTRLDLRDGASLLCYPIDRAAYGRLCRLLTTGKRRAPKAECHLMRADLAEFCEGQIFIVLAPDNPGDDFIRELREWQSLCPGNVYLAGQWLHRGDDAVRLARLQEIAHQCGTPLVATNDVHYHAPERRPLQDVLTCIRNRTTITEAGRQLAANAERHLKTPAEMARLFARYPDAIARTMEIVERCTFSMDELRYEYPEEIEADGLAPQERLEKLTWEGAAWRYPEGIPDDVRDTLKQELELIGQMNYAPYFLTVHSIVQYARSHGILCQGRGSAANSAVCFCLGITSVDPKQINLLFCRFISTDRNEPPDIDVDFEHERREEVIQHIYKKYGLERAGLTATVIHYRSRTAIRDVGKAMGLSEDVVAAMANARWGSSREALSSKDSDAANLDTKDPLLARTLELASELIGFPRHLSQHVGGFVISKARLDELVPIENAAMKGRTVICWDKDDIAALRLMKVDVLALGMLSCLHRGFDLLKQHRSMNITLASLPPEDPATYEMLCKADSIGVFQVESRAQMSMLPRLKPREFYDLVIEVAIVRPGPIQGNMVHPYLRRRNREEEVDYPSEELRDVLSKTNGVPLFQEQAMRIVMVAGGFSSSDADGLRRAMASWRRNGSVDKYKDQLLTGMIARKYTREFAERIFSQIEGFGDYGFPESHAASFAHLVYASAWMKCRHPEIFACALLNSMPMGFYAPAQIVRDAREHGVEIRPVDINHSDWECTLEPADGKFLALRLGLRQIAGMNEKNAELLVNARENGLFTDAHDLWRRTGLPVAILDRLAWADAFTSLGLSRRRAAWAVRGLGAMSAKLPKLVEALPLFAAAAPLPEPEAALPLASMGEEVTADYATVQLSLKSHPMALMRETFASEGVVPAVTLRTCREGPVSVAGLVLVRQHPGSAKVIFMTLEDETGVANVVVQPHLFEQSRRAVLGGLLLRIDGHVQREGKDDYIVTHVLAKKITDLSHRLRAMGGEGRREPRYHSRDFH